MVEARATPERRKASAEAGSTPEQRSVDSGVETSIGAAEVSLQSGDRPLATRIPDLGVPAWSFHEELRFKAWAKDGGAIQAERAPDGQEFLVVTFPETAERRMTISYVSSDFGIQTSESNSMPPHGVTPGGGYEVLGPDVFHRDVFMTSRECSAGSPFAVVFIVPRGLREARLVVKGASVGLTR